MRLPFSLVRHDGNTVYIYGFPETHFYRECFLEAYTVTECPHCSKPLSSLNVKGEQQVLCTVRNEGGVQEKFDILPSATDEAYLRTYPEERRGHAYLDFCRMGDIDALIHLIQDGSAEEDSEGSERSLDLLRYTGSFEGIEGSGLHVAIRNNQQDVAWLMLVLGSSLDWTQFPPIVLHATESMGLSKDDRSAQPDVRTLKDNEGKTAAVVAKEAGGVWSDWIKSGRLDPPT
jgi:hypothetical protein